MSDWMYNDFPVTEVPEGYTDFVYLIEIADKFYYGKKSFGKSIKRPPLKGYKRHRRDTVESNWKTYCSSSNKVKNLVEAGFKPDRYIVRLCKGKKEATWFENKLLVQHIAHDDCLNDNISGKFFKEEVQKWESMT